MYSISLFYYHL